MTERWRAVVGWEAFYEVSDLGNVRRIAGRVDGRGPQIVSRLLKPKVGKTGYLTVCLKPGGVTKYVHRLVVEAFFAGSLAPGVEVNHIDGVKDRNALVNLEPIDRRGNVLHARDVLGTGKNPPAQRGEANPKAVLTEDDVRAIRRRAEAEQRTGFKRFRRGSGFVEGLAKEYGVTVVTISNVIAGRFWKDTK